MSQEQPTTPPAENDAPHGLTKDGRPRRKPGPAKGTRPAGRKKGVPNKATVERELAERLMRERVEMEMKAEASKNEMLAAMAKGKKLAKEVLGEFMELFAGMAAFYQPLPDGQPVTDGRKPDEGKFKDYAAMAVDAAKALAPFQSPRFSAMMVGATVVNKIEVEGGLPNDFDLTTPAPRLEPGTIVTADDVEDAKVIDIVPKIAANEG
jgi:hypothetical protein